MLCRLAFYILLPTQPLSLLWFVRPRNVHPLCVAGLSATTQRNAMQLIWFSLAWGVGLLVVFQVFGDYLPLLFTSDKQVKKNAE